MNLFAITSEQGCPGEPTGLERLDARLLADIGYAPDGTPLIADGRRRVVRLRAAVGLSNFLDWLAKPIELAARLL